MPSGTIPLQGTKLKLKERTDNEEENFSFSLVRGAKSYFVAGRTQQDYDEWVEAVTAATSSKTKV